MALRSKMVMVLVDGSSQVIWCGLRACRRVALSVHSLYELSELMQFPSRDDIVSVVVVAAGDRALVQWSTLTVDIIG